MVLKHEEVVEVVVLKNKAMVAVVVLAAIMVIGVHVVDHKDSNNKDKPNIPAQKLWIGDHQGGSTHHLVRHLE